MFKEIIKWNEIAGFNSENLNRHLETSMLMEEVSELIIAMKNKDKVEMLDGFADIIFVLTGLMYKHGFTDKQLELGIQEVIRSNYSKFTKEGDEYKVIRDEGGKIMKPDTFSEPDLKSIISKDEDNYQTNFYAVIGRLGSKYGININRIKQVYNHIEREELSIKDVDDTGNGIFITLSNGFNIIVDEKDNIYYSDFDSFYGRE